MVVLFVVYDVFVDSGHGPRWNGRSLARWPTVAASNGNDVIGDERLLDGRLR